MASRHSSYTITNIVAKIQLEPLDLERVFKICGGKYNPKKFPAVFLKLDHGTTTMFGTGTVTFIGHNSIPKIRDAIIELELRLGNLFKPVDATPTVATMACTFHGRQLERSINLHDLSAIFNAEKSRSALYEPTEWNSLQLYLTRKGRAILHHTGQGIITGMKSEEEIRKAIDYIDDCIDAYLIEQYFKQ